MDPMAHIAITTSYHVGMYQPPSGRPVWHTVRDAAEATGAKSDAIRRSLRRHGVRVGRTVSGMVEMHIAGRVGFMPVSATRAR